MVFRLMDFTHLLFNMVQKVHVLYSIYFVCFLDFNNIKSKMKTGYVSP